MLKVTIVKNVKECIKAQGNMSALPECKHDLIKDCHFDSMDKVELAVMLEQDFNIEIDDCDFEKLKTVQDIADMIQSNL